VLCEEQPKKKEKEQKREIFQIGPTKTKQKSLRWQNFPAALSFFVADLFFFFFFSFFLSHTTTKPLLFLPPVLNTHTPHRILVVAVCFFSV
jgi:hypothetical protein